MDFRELYVIEEMKVAMETRGGKGGLLSLQTNAGSSQTTREIKVSLNTAAT